MTNTPELQKTLVDNFIYLKGIIIENSNPIIRFEERDFHGQSPLSYGRDKSLVKVINEVMGKKIRLYIADDHFFYRKGIITILNNGNEFEITEAENGKILIDLVKKQVPDIVLLDMNMPVLDGRETCIYLERKFPSVKIIILSMDDDAIIVRNLLNIGAHAYLNKASCGEELRIAISTVIQKDFYFNELAKRAYHSREDFNHPCDTHILSLRELEVVKMIAEEYTMKEIADRLFISEKTVQNHRTSLMKKLGALNTAGLIKKAFVRGVLIP